MSEFELFIQALNLKHFQASELLIATTNPGNSEPPKNIWDNIVPTILILDQLREHFAKPISITSTYRNEAYNKMIGGVSTSQHTAFTAIDFKVKNVRPRKVKDLLVDWRDNQKRFPLPRIIRRKTVLVSAGPIGQESFEMDTDPTLGKYFIFAGGIGVYNSFVHLDTRGTNHVWYNDSIGEQSA